MLPDFPSCFKFPTLFFLSECSNPKLTKQLKHPNLTISSFSNQNSSKQDPTNMFITIASLPPQFKPDL